MMLLEIAVGDEAEVPVSMRDGEKSQPQAGFSGAGTTE
jgi:hypothetical protein